MFFSFHCIRSVSVGKKGKLDIKALTRTDADAGMGFYVLWAPQYFPGVVQMLGSTLKSLFPWFCPAENKIDVK